MSPRWPWWWSPILAAMLAGCATSTFDNAPRHVPVTPAFVAQASAPRDIVGRRVIGVPLSGGGLRAAAFGLGVLQALAGADAPEADVDDDLSFISSVSGGSLLAAWVGLHGRDGLQLFRERVLLQDLERDLRLDWRSLSNLSRLLTGGLNDRSNLAQRLDTEVFGGATFADLYHRIPFPFMPVVLRTHLEDCACAISSLRTAASPTTRALFFFRDPGVPSAARDTCWGRSTGESASRRPR